MRIYSNWSFLEVEKTFCFYFLLFHFILYFGGIKQAYNIFRMFVLVPTRTVKLPSAFGSLKSFKKLVLFI